ncbi:MAG: carboxypeptidase regulatory-like domain-containing protein [Acidobacteria bacterium]|nr:carboxypeptidase regulatory-like domain-containing protein [Acidobacteriota bacterium]
MRLLALLLALAPLHAQTVDLTVKVIDAVTLAGVPGAKVRLTQSAPSGGYQNTIGNDGTFTVRVPPNARIEIADVGAEGYATAGPERIEMRGAPATVTVRLMRTGTLAGRILDADSGEPLARVTVEPLHFAWVRGRPELRRVLKSVVTGKDGAFTFPSLIPGAFALDINSYSANAKSVPVPGYPNLVWPGAGDLTGASPVDLPYGGTLNLGDIKLRKRELSKVTVAIEGGQCSAGQAYTVTLEQYSFSSGFTRAFSTAPCGGTATLSNVTPGDFEISVQADWQPDQQRERAAVPIQIAKAEEEVTATVTPPIAIRGTVTVDRDAALPSGIEISLWARGSKQNGSLSHTRNFGGVRTSAGGTFEARSYVPAGGEIEVTATPLPPTYYIRELRYAGNTVPGNTFLIHTGATVQDLTIVLSNRAATLTGAVRTSGGATVSDAKVLLTSWPADVVSDYPFGVEEAATSASGGYSFTHLRPGTYRVIAVPAAARPRLEEPGAMLALFQSSESFELGEAASSVRQLELVVR